MVERGNCGKLSSDLCCSLTWHIVTPQYTQEAWYRLVRQGFSVQLWLSWPPASALRVLGLKVIVTTAQLKLFFLKLLNKNQTFLFFMSYAEIKLRTLCMLDKYLIYH
jgi:hypothetical protein